MNLLEHDILEKFRQLSPQAQQRVRALIEQETTTEFDYDTWFATISEIRQEIRGNHAGNMPEIDGVSLLRDIRDGEDE